jgi:heme-degrading monooxygenase HmoA
VRVFARVASFEGPDDSVREGMQLYVDQVLPWVRDTTGFRGLAVLNAAEGGRVVAITFWETEEAMLADEEGAAPRFRELIGGSVGVPLKAVDFYEVDLMELSG